MEWIIVDDGTDKIKDLVDAANIPQIKYFPLDTKLKLGAKRNYMHQKTTGSILVYMDDDDYYPPERVAHAVDRLREKPEALCAGSSEIYVYFKHIQKMYQGGPYGPNHATAGTFAFRRELLSQSQYEDDAALAEEKAFLKNYTVPFVQLDPLKTILVFSHIQNTFDKRNLLDKKHERFFRESPKTVDMFIKFDHEKSIKQYFLEDIDAALDSYQPGDPSMKPDVMEQIVELDKKREQMMKEAEKQQAAAGGGQIMLQQPGHPPRALTAQELVQLLKQQQDDAQKKAEKITQLERLVSEMQKKLIEYKKKEVVQVTETPEPVTKPVTEPVTEPVPSSPLPSRIPIVETCDVGTSTYEPFVASKLAPEVLVTIP